MSECLLGSIGAISPIGGANTCSGISKSFSVAAVTAPTIDKYSGDMLFIDNKAGFTPSINESVNLRTVIRF